jgi:catechol 2,3-dioxygenase-like lactoylglutathione lyase family enzyme
MRGGIVQRLSGVAADALTVHEGTRTCVDGFAKPPDRLEIGGGDRRSRREQTCGHRPTAEIVRRPEPFDAAPPPLTHGGGERQAGPAGDEPEREIVGRRARSCGTRPCGVCHVTTITRDVPGRESLRRHAEGLVTMLISARRRLGATAWVGFLATIGPGSRNRARDDVPMSVTGLDHLVLTVDDIDATIAFYRTALGMREIAFGAGRRALAFGDQKINLHPHAAPITPHARRPTPGSADLCLLTDVPIRRVVQHLQASGVPVEEGPVHRTGATSALLSVYVRDPDGNLVEISNAPARAGAYPG